MVKFVTIIAIACASFAAAAPVARGAEETSAEKRTNSYIGYGSEGEYEAVNAEKRTNSYIGYGSEGEYEAVNNKRTNSYIGYGSEGEYEAVNNKKRTNSYIGPSTSGSSEPFIPKHSKDEYSEVRTSDEEDPDLFVPRTRPKSRIRTIFSWIIKAIILALALHSFITLSISAAIYIREATLPPCYCGTSTAEALAMGCKYDSLATSWLPAHCRDDELTALFEHAGNGPNGEWLYHASNTSSSRLFSLEEMAYLADKPDPERQAWSTIDWHNMHCFYTLVKQMRGKVKMEYTGFPNATAHAEHCAVAMTDRIPRNKIVIGMSPGFGDPTGESEKMK
ncbi:hypothetical protein F5Y02DRAFT_431716 [Annulohypoxylon stygium]|nr:hypothetical protein F5Y02DRAFT_431716 [Annulohypoxylon stygium]